MSLELASLKRIRSIATEKTWRHQFFSCSWAANSIVSGPIWPKFELMQDIMHVYVSSNFKKDQYQPRKSGDTDVLDAQGQLTLYSVV